MISPTSSTSYDSYGYDSESYDQSDKKRARGDFFAGDNGVDRISELPDPIILHILSFLEAKDAVRTGVLSTRFASLWTDVDSLNFVNSKLDFIYNTLFFHNRSFLHKFSIHYTYDDNTQDAVSKFDQLFRLLFRSCPVKDITLVFINCSYRLPEHFHSNSSLLNLNLFSCAFSGEEFIKWESLQSLTVSNIDFPDVRMADILSGCPSLEVFELLGCGGFSHISLNNNKRLKKLVIKYHIGSDEPLEIFAPYLQSFVLSGVMAGVTCRIFFADSLTSCCLDFHNEFGTFNDSLGDAMAMLIDLLEDVCHVKDDITIGEWGLWVLSLIEREGLPFPLSESRVKCLKLRTTLTADVMIGIKWLLRGLNCLEKLSITHSSNTLYLPRFWGRNLRLGSEDVEIDSDIKLKKVEIIGYRARNCCESMIEKPQVVLLVRFLLKNTKFLEEMIIICPDDPFCPQYLTKLSDQLLRFSRSSRHAVLRVL